jgi:chorismate dehydratase
MASTTEHPLRIGVVDFSNAAPLTEGLPEVQLRRGTPSEVADWLATGEVDVSLVPTIELGRIAGAMALPRWGIAADGACESVLLFSRKPLRDVRRVVLDSASRSASALTRIILEREGARDVAYVKRLGGDVEARLAEADATLLIGDPCLRARPPKDVTTFDLAAEWKRHVGLPFVFACWATRAGRRLGDEEVALFDAAARQGLERIDEVAARWAVRTGVAAARLEAYLRSLRYRLDQDDLRAIRAFLDEAHRVGILQRRAEVTFLSVTDE